MNRKHYLILVRIFSLISLCQSLLASIPSSPFRKVSLSAEADDEFSEDDFGAAIFNTTERELHVDRAILQRLEEDDDVSCVPPGSLDRSTKLVFLVSDATGVTARSTLLKSLAQFGTCADDLISSGENDGMNDPWDACDVQTRTFTFIRSTAALAQILQTAQNKKACIMYTLADPVLRQYAMKTCKESGVPHIDLMGPALDVLGGFLEREPQGISGRFETKSPVRRTLGDSYYQRMDAVEFCLKADDGQSPWLLPEADIIIVGVSRSGKTPLSVVLSQTMSLKVANIPLVLEVPPPSQLVEEVDPRRVFCLTIAPTQLRKIRSSRLERRNVRKVENQNKNSAILDRGKSNYADRNYLLKDLQSARKLAQEHNWTEIDVTGRAVEETATIIVELFNERFEGELSPNSLR